MSLTRPSQELLAAFDSAVAAALVEDLGEIGIESDVTTKAVVPDDLLGAATVYAKQAGVICGLEALAATYAQLDAGVSVAQSSKDGDGIQPGDAVATVEGPAAAILVGERSALNLIGHLSGIATLVRTFVRAAPGAILTDTRKTLPGLRLLQKYAVRIGGASNHRFALWDGVLVKDNHIAAGGGVGQAVKRARASTSLPVQAECTSLQEVDEALEAGAMALLLDNRSTDELRRLVEHIRSRADHVMIEASGGITLDSVAEVATTGVDRISVGAFTHSAPALDVSMKLERVWRPN
ncbi:MAG TPA: carboxylating nicotinate-nucleotide diphosphorylase [Actinomycetota bacterium]|nr:carboxylating nicotinate-nucleotide diphosphorylase [Actinomycetota bacterium]